jgi:hypothetical protein
MKKILLLSITSLCFHLGFSQSDNCNTATVISVTNGVQACVNGTNANSTSSLTTNGCSSDPVNEVWYTYTVTGANNNFFLDPGTLQDAVITIYADGCGTGSYDYCTTSAGTTDINFNFGLDVGTQVWISIASNSLTDGNFDFCITSSTPPANPPGNTSCSAIAVCDNK